MIGPILLVVIAAMTPMLLRAESNGLKGKQRRRAGRAIRRAERRLRVDPEGCVEEVACDWLRRGVYAETQGEVTVIRFKEA